MHNSIDHILVTGGAGFIGSHLADRLLEDGRDVTVLDTLDEQVHPAGARPAYLDERVRLQRGDVRDPAVVRRALDGVDAVVHLAARVGVGQSMYEVRDYTEINNVGTAVLLEALAERPVARLVVASSMSVYGEGRYRDGDGRMHDRASRSRAQLEQDDWEVRDASGAPLEPVPTPEDTALELASVYALSKFDQERLCLMLGEAYGIPTVALRLFNVYGPRQALSNPYTGVLAIFASRLLNDRPPLVFEDGYQRRDFVNVHDVARAFRLALDRDDVAGEVFNIGSGEARSIREVAEALAAALGKEIAPRTTGDYRVGDIRNCFADIGRARERLGYEPRVAFDDGLRELTEWLAGRESEDRSEEARRELAARGLAL